MGSCCLDSYRMSQTQAAEPVCLKVQNISDFCCQKLSKLDRSVTYRSRISERSQILRISSKVNSDHRFGCDPQKIPIRQKLYKTKVLGTSTAVCGVSNFLSLQTLKRLLGKEEAFQNTSI